MTGGAGPAGSNPACAACKYQRRKCAPDCPLAPYFPPDQPKRFHNVHKLFGVSNLLRILRAVEPSKREDTVKSIVYEADTREKDPVNGCLGVISMLQNQVNKLKEELALARDQLYLVDQQQHAILNQVYAHQHGGTPTSLVHPWQYVGSPHPNFNDSGAQPSFDKSMAAFHDQSRFGADTAALHDMLGQQFKVEPPDRFNRLDLSRVRYEGETVGLQDQQGVPHTLADLQQRRNVFNLPNSNQAHHDPLQRVGLQSVNTQHVSDHELRNAGVHLSLTNQYSV